MTPHSSSPSTSGRPSARTVNVQALIDGAPFSARQWLICALCFVVVLLDGFDTAAIGFIAPSLLKDWGVTKPMLGGVLSAALFGLAAGAFVAGPLSDRLGRKAVLTASVALFGFACLASAFSQNLGELTAMRFLTGLGLGAAMPNAVTLTSEYCPQRRRATLTNLIFCGFPLGAALGGFLAAWMIPHWGWRSVLTVGGMAPLVLLIALALYLPESARLLVARRAPVARIKATLARVLSVDVQGYERFEQSEQHPAAQGQGGLRQVLSPAYRVGTVMLWVAYFMGLVIFYASINWMPTLFKEAGINGPAAAVISALFPLGGLGAVFCGWFMDRFEGNRILATGFLLTSVSVWLIGRSAGSTALLTVTVLLAGVLMNTAQSSLPSLAAAFYPTSARATGVAWMMGIGRFGGIAGSLLVAEMAARHLTFDAVFTVLAVPGLLAAIALWIKRGADPADAGTSVPAREHQLSH